MLARLIGFSVRQPSLVIVLSALVVVLAGARLGSTPVDVFPELNAPTVVVMTECGGLAADEVELGVTFPIETAVNGLPGARRVRSASATSLSIVWVEFDWGFDLFRARQLVAERLAAVRESLPPEAHAEIAPMTSITGEIMLLAVSSPDGTVSPLELRAYAEFDLRNRLLAVPGVAQVVAIGGELPQYKVEVRADRLAALGVSIDEVVEAAREAHSMASAGYLADSEGQEVPVRQFARVGGVDDLARTLVAIRGGAPVLLGDVADVSLGAAPRRGTAADEALPAVVVSVQKTPGTNTLELTRAVDGALDAAERALPAGVRLNRDPFRAARFIDRAVDNVSRVLVEASVIVAIVIVLFLLDVRATLVTLVALPVSLAVALLVLSLAGLSLNVMTLGGLAVAIGELVDDAVIDVENVLRRLRGAPRGADAAETIVAASNEIRASVVFATILICLVFVPLLFLSGLEGRFFRPLGIAYIVSILASLAVALTLTPALCRVLLGRGARDARAGHGDGALVSLLKRAYEPVLRVALRHGALVMAGSAALAAGALLLASTYGSSFLPTFQEGTFTVFVMSPPGTSLVESDRLANAVERGFIGIDGVSSVTRRTGRAERDEHAEPVSSSEIEVTVGPDGDQRAVRREIDRVLANVPGVTTMVGQPIEHRLSHLLSGTPAAIAIGVYGDDLGVLRATAREIETALRAVEGARDVNANREVLVATLPIRYRAEDLAAAGLTPGAAARQVQRAVAGERVAEVVDGARRIEIVVRAAEGDRDSPARIGELPLVGAGGATVRLREVADLGVERASNLITREATRRKAVVSLNVAEGHNLGDLVARVRAVVDPIVARAGATVVYGGQFEAQQSASRTILWMGALVVVAMLFILRAATGSVATALLVMLNLPLALIGGVVAVFLAGDASPVANALALAGVGDARFVAPVLSVASLVGFFTLFGIAVRNGLLLVNHYAHLEKEEACGVEESVVRGSLERLAPILMTALTAALGLAPLALRGDAPGNEILAPLATVVLGGLASSTLLNLFVVPAGYRWLRRRYAFTHDSMNDRKPKEMHA